MTQESRALVLAPKFVVPPTEIAARIQELQAFVRDYMVKDEDYGTIPGTPKPTLYKPGAEKLCDIYGFQRLFQTMNRVEDWEAGLFHYEVRADLLDSKTGLIVAQGLGSANSKEARYRWRQAERHCPECGQSAIIKGKAEYGGGWLCFRKKGGCGAKFMSDDAQITDQEVGRIENDDPYTLVNTLLKMAKKRALVDAVLSATRSSGLFTQDVEDMGVIEGSATVIHDDNDKSGPPAFPSDRWKCPNCSAGGKTVWNVADRCGKCGILRPGMTEEEKLNIRREDAEEADITTSEPEPEQADLGLD